MVPSFISPNISSNGSLSSSSGTQLNSFSLRAIKITLCTVVSLLSVLGNLLVIFAVYRVNRMRTTTFYLLVNMSISDILFTVISMPPFILVIAGYDLLFGSDLGSFICKFVNSSAFCLMASSVLTMTAIAFDRFFVITKPMRDIINITILQRMVIAIWVISLLVSSPLIYSYRLGQDDIGYYCYENWSPIFDEVTGNRVYTLIGFTVIYMVPFTTIAVLYSLVAKHLWFGHSQIQQSLLKSRRKVVIMLISVLVFFIICWLPLQVMTLLASFSESKSSDRELIFMGEFLIRTNAAVNPLLYVVFSGTFRQAVKDAFIRSGKRNKLIITMQSNDSTRRPSISANYLRRISEFHHNDSFKLKTETN